MQTIFMSFAWSADQVALRWTWLGAIFILRKDIGVGGPENGNFPLLYVVKMSLRRWVGDSKKPQNTLT